MPFLNAKTIADLAELNRIAKDLPNGDLDRLLWFARDLQTQRLGKREQRSKARAAQTPELDNWRIGS